MTKLSVVKILKGNRVTLPIEFLITNGLKEGNFIGYKFESGNNKISFIPVDITERDE